MMVSDKIAARVEEGSEVVAQNSPRKTASSRGRRHIPYRTIIVMLAGLLFGVVAAVGHHVWNSHWNGMVVEKAPISQTWIRNFGTAFAFLVKMFLAIITSTAFVQQLWITLKAKPVAIGEMDSMFTVLQSALQFLSIKIWVNNPLLALLAIITWLLPLAAVVTPGTLNVISVNTTSVLQNPVSQFDFTDQSINYGSSATGSGKALGTTPKLQRLSVFTTAGSEIGQIRAPYPNSSYELEFFGPALSCSPTKNASLATRVTGWLQSFGGGAAPYLSFVPAQLDYVSSTFSPFGSGSDVLNFYGFGYNYDVRDNQTTTVFVVMQNGTYVTASSWPMIECTLYNASYQVGFEFTYPQQNINIIQRTLRNPVLIPSDQNATFGTPTWAYMNMMDAYTNILIGYTEISRDSSTSFRTMYKNTALIDLDQDKGFSADQLTLILETMFQNITISLLSDTSFQPNTSLAQAQRVPVTVHRVENVYDYRSEDLYLAYGLSIFITFGCLVLGLISIHRNSGSYTNDFSTILRTTRHISLREVVDPAQSNGLSPLGRDLAEVKIVMDSDGYPDVPAGFRVTQQLEAEAQHVEAGGKQSGDNPHHPLLERKNGGMVEKVHENV